MTTASTTTALAAPIQPFLPHTRLSLTVREILVSDLPPNEQLRCDPPDRDLISDVKALGLLQPIILVEKTTGGYTVADGRSRIWAARLAGLTSLPAMVVPEGQITPSAIGAKANTLRRDNPRTLLTFIAEAEAAGLDDKALCAVGGFSAAELKAARKLLTLIPLLRAAFDAGKIRANVAREAAALTEAQQTALAAKLAAEGKLTVASVRQAKCVTRAESAAALPLDLFTTPDAAGPRPWRAEYSRLVLQALALVPTGESAIRAKTKELLALVGAPAGL